MEWSGRQQGPLPKNKWGRCKTGPMGEGRREAGRLPRTLRGGKENRGWADGCGKGEEKRATDARGERDDPVTKRRGGKGQAQTQRGW